MFKVKDRYGLDKKIYIVYAVRTDDSDETEFLVFDTCWRWESADIYIPFEEVE